MKINLKKIGNWPFGATKYEKKNENGIKSLIFQLRSIQPLALVINVPVYWFSELNLHHSNGLVHLTFFLILPPLRIYIGLEYESSVICKIFEGIQDIFKLYRLHTTFRIFDKTLEFYSEVPYIFPSIFIQIQIIVFDRTSLWSVVVKTLDSFILFYL